MVRYSLPYKGLLLGALLGALAYVPLGLLGAVFIGRAIDAIVGAGDVEFAAVLLNLEWLAATTVASALWQWLMMVCTRKASAYAAQQMRRQAFERLNDVSLGCIDTQPHGDIVSRLVNDADNVSEGYLQALTQFFPSVVTIVATIVLMFTLNALIALVVIVATPLSILFARLVTRRTGKMFLLQSKAQGAVASQVGEAVNNQALLSAFGYAKASEEEFDVVNEAYFGANFKATVYSSFINPGTRYVNAIVYTAVGVFGALLALQGGITVGGISAFLAYANQYTKPFNEITAVFTQLQAAVAGAERLFEVIDWASETPDVPDAASPSHSEGRVVTRDVYFSYTPGRKLIQDLNLEIDYEEGLASA
jgi:ATP-binding cassette subfamily B protein